MKKAKITGSAQTFLVKNVLASADYYRQKMGFSCTLLGEPAQYCIAARDNHHVMLAQVDEITFQARQKTIPDMWDAYFWVDNIEALYVELDQKGVNLDYGLKVAHYGVKEFGIKDIDGNEIAFGQVVK